MIDRSRLINTRARGKENGRCSSDHITQWRININVILYKEHVRACSHLASFVTRKSAFLVK